MLASEQLSWGLSKNDLEVLENTGFYKNDVELQKLVQQAEEVLMKIIPSPIAFGPMQMSETNVKLWEQFHPLRKRIDDRVKENAKQNKILIVYYSKFNGKEIGVRKKYARKLCNALFRKKFSTEHFGSENLNADELKEYSTIIFCSSSYFGTNKIASLIVEHFEKLKNKKVVLFTCGLAKFTDRMISLEIREKLKIFHVKGGFFVRFNEKIFEPIIDCCSQNYRIIDELEINDNEKNRQNASR